MTFAGAKIRSFLPTAALATATAYLSDIAGVIVVGHCVGSSALASINLLLPVFSVTTFVTLLFATGTSVLFSTEIGRFDERRAREFFSQGLLATLGFGILLAALYFFGADAFLAYCGATAEVSAGAKTYLTAVLPTCVLFPLSGFLSSLVLADGDRKLVSAANAVRIAVLFAASVPLTRVCGLRGCAVGVCLSAFASILVLARHFFRPGNNLRFVRHFAWRDLGRICGCSFGDAAADLCNAGLLFLVNTYVIAHFGTARLPLLTVLLTALGAERFFDAISTAIQPLATTYIGERNVVRTEHVMNLAVVVSLALGAALTLAFLAFPQFVLALVGLDDPALVPAAKVAVRIAAIDLLGMSMIMLFNSYYMYVERSCLATFVTVLSFFGAQIALYPALGRFFGETGVWLALALAPYAALVVIALVVLGIGGRANFPYLLDRARRSELRVFDLTLEPAAICATSDAVTRHLKARGVDAVRVSRAALLVEETLMVVRDRNAPKRIRAEVTVDLGADGVALVVRDDGEIFDITDTDARVASLRSYLVSNLMGELTDRHNLTATGFNRNVFRP